MTVHQNLAIGAVAVSATLLTYFIMQQRKKTWKKVGTISKLFIYPLKSAHPVEVKKFFCHKFGPAASETSGYDRGFFIVDEKGGMVTGRQDGRTVLIYPTVHPDHITLNYKNKKPIDVPVPTDVNKVIFCKLFKKDVLGIDCGEEVAQWLNEIFEGRKYKLVYYPHFVVGHETYQRHMMTGSGSFVAAYQDISPFNFLSEGSMDDLNSRLEKKVTPISFRPNVLIKGCDAFSEDTWMKVRINNVEFHHIMRTGRCLLTTVDPDTGVAAKDFEPLKTLRKYRQGTAKEREMFGESPKFGNHFTTDQEGWLSVGDDVYCLV